MPSELHTLSKEHARSLIAEIGACGGAVLLASLAASESRRGPWCSKRVYESPCHTTRTTGDQGLRVP